LPQEQVSGALSCSRQRNISPQTIECILHIDLKKYSPCLHIDKYKSYPISLSLFYFHSLPKISQIPAFPSYPCSYHSG